MISQTEICVITPTKGRHRQLRTMLETLACQTVRIGQVIIADGGRDAEELVGSFAGKLPLKWLDCETPGQIAQRNHALGQISAAIKVVIYLDDDIQLEPDAISQLIAFWNRQEPEPAGVSFNELNLPPQKDSFFRHMFCMAAEPRGKVWKSGYNSPVGGISNDIQSQWLPGGITAWRRDIVENHKNQALATSWAICEDLIFSYPLSKSDKLHVCASARVHHVDDLPADTFHAGLFRGSKAVVARYFFVCRNPELSKPLFFWMVSGQMVARLMMGLSGRLWNFGYLAGNAKGVLLCLRAMLMNEDIRNTIESKG